MTRAIGIYLKIILKWRIYTAMRMRFPPMPRRALKTLTYSVMHFAVAITVAFALTRSWQAALAIGMIEPLVQTVAYTVHERVWERLGIAPRSALLPVSAETPDGVGPVQPA